MVILIFFFRFIIIIFFCLFSLTLTERGSQNSCLGKQRTGQTRRADETQMLTRVLRWSLEEGSI